MVDVSPRRTYQSQISTAIQLLCLAIAKESRSRPRHSRRQLTIIRPAILFTESSLVYSVSRNFVQDATDANNFLSDVGTPRTVNNN